MLETNPRGSTGYGAAFAAANKNDLGGGDYQDIMTGVDTVLAKFPIDANKMALIGYSYGGEMAGFVEGKTDRFRAIVSGAPVIDQMSEYGTESSSYYDRWFYGFPWEHQQDAWRQSPISGVAHAKTPFLLLQGKDDTTDPAGQSEEMYRALRQAGVTVELVEYPRENHGPLARGMLGSPAANPGTASTPASASSTSSASNLRRPRRTRSVDSYNSPGGLDLSMRLGCMSIPVRSLACVTCTYQLYRSEGLTNRLTFEGIRRNSPQPDAVGPLRLLDFFALSKMSLTVLMG